MQGFGFLLFRGFNRVLYVLRRRHWCCRCRRRLRISRRCVRRCRCFRDIVNSFRSSRGKHRRSTLLGHYRRLLRFYHSILVNANARPDLRLLLLLLLLLWMRPLSRHRHSRPCDRRRHGIRRHRTLRCRLRQYIWRLRHWGTRLKLIILIRSRNRYRIGHGNSRHHHLLQSLQGSLL